MVGAPQVAVIGVGNDFRRDDAAGWRVVRSLERGRAWWPLPPGTSLRVCDGDPARLIGLWEGADLAVVVDAAHAHPPHPGRVHRLELDGRTGWVGATRPSPVDRGGGETPCADATSSHGLGLGEAFELARVLGRLPKRMVVYAVEGADSDFGSALSPAVAAAVEPLTIAVRQELARHAMARCRDEVLHGKL